eukprot:14994064-Alexandrium_andersonii.AAC.1
MSASLVGSEMCIRDRAYFNIPTCLHVHPASLRRIATPPATSIRAVAKSLNMPDAHAANATALANYTCLHHPK